MELTISERFALIGVLPERGNVATLRILGDLRRQLALTEEEFKHFGVKNSTLPDGRASITWNPKLAKETKEIKIGKAAKGEIVKNLKRLDAQNQLHISMLPIYEKFVEKTKD